MINNENAKIGVVKLEENEKEKEKDKKKCC